jgi:Uma2 family endonuclease
VSIALDLISPNLKERVVMPTEPVWRLSVDEYHQMIDAGILTENEPIELLEGLLVPKMAKKPLHSVITYLLRQLIEKLLPSGWYVDEQEPLTTEDSEPEPDVMVVRGQRRQYLERHPGPQEVALVVEVADTTLRRDRTTKKRLYARAGIPVYWVVNLTEQQIEVYAQPIPNDADYAQHNIYELSDDVPVVIDNRTVAYVSVKNLLSQ